MRTEGIEVHVSNPDQFGQYMLTSYHDSHGTTRTVAWRQHVEDTWGPEHVLFPADAEVAS